MDRGNSSLLVTFCFFPDSIHIWGKPTAPISSCRFALCQLCRTERLNNTSSPSFSQRLRVDYHFEMVQNLKFGVYDIDNSTSNLADDDYLGGTELTLGQVITIQGRSFTCFSGKRPENVKDLSMTLHRCLCQHSVIGSWESSHPFQANFWFHKSSRLNINEWCQ